MGNKILLAEDSLTIRKVFELALARTDILLTTVDNGNDAVRLAAETAPDLVVADVTLPGKDGFQVAEDLRSSEKTKTCPVLILSGTISPFDEDRFKKCGAAGVLFKPFDSQDMLDKVQELIRGREEIVHAEKGEVSSQAEEPWDFSDVIEEVTREGGKPPVLAPPQRGEDLLPGAASDRSGKAEGGVYLGEFDVSLEEIEERPAPVPESVPADRDAAVVSHLEGDPFTDAPQAVTDLSPALESVEDLVEIEEMEEVDILQKALEETPAASPAPEKPPPAPSIAEKPVPPAPAVAPVAETAVSPPPAAPPVVEMAVPPAPVPPPLAAASDDEARALFAARANEIIEKVAAETVEKVLWEYMERFSGEFSAKLRETLESVAWEVIPSTAEALIREEITRIREQSGKKSP